MAMMMLPLLLIGSAIMLPAAGALYQAAQQQQQRPRLPAGSCVVSSVLGCYKDNDPTCKQKSCRGPRLLSFRGLVGDAHMTHERCAQACCAAGFIGPAAVAGVEFGDECYCSHGFNATAATPEPAASCAARKCPGNSSQDCGDSYRIVVFRATCHAPCRAPTPRPPAPAPSPPPTPALLKCWDQSSPISSTQYCNPKLSADERVADLLPRLTTAEKLARVEWGCAMLLYCRMRA
jgi:hypothetical protein